MPEERNPTYSFDNPLVMQFAKSFLRWMLGLISAVLVKHGIITLQEGGSYIDALTSPEFILGAFGFVGQLGWALAEKYGLQQKISTALAHNRPTTEHAIEEIIRTGQAAPVTTPKTEVPKQPALPPSGEK